MATGSKLALLADFGSTFTKLAAVDLDAKRIIATSASPTTLSEGIMVGLERALSSLDSGRFGGIDQLFHWETKLACSSAAGGLRMVAIGLVPELTAEAAKRAALGAGARILATYSYELNSHEVAEIEEMAPDIVLLAGGTDGGNKVVLLANAEALAASTLTAPILVAGNKVVSPTAVDTLRSAGKDARLTENVMPELGRLNVEGVRATIREVFIERIVSAKGLDEAQATMSNGLLMPTPAAVLEAARLLADGTKRRPGLGDVMVVDPGGATTDVHSVSEGRPTLSNVIVRGLPEPRVKRTVEGDLGVRHSGISLGEAIGYDALAKWTGLSYDDVYRMVQELPSRAGDISTGDDKVLLDSALAKGAVKVAISRHVGSLETAYTPLGISYILRGKDLTSLPYVIGSGGPIIYSKTPREILESALFDESEPDLLRPKHPQFMLDARYILSAMGLLATVNPEVAFEILINELVEL